MPTIPLDRTPPLANAWHAVRSPGGCEWWRFDAEDDTGSTRVILDLLEGDPFSADYRKQYRRYRRRPTHYAPPLPAHFSRASVTVYRDGKTSYSTVSDPMIAATDTLLIDVGPKVAVSDDEDGVIHIDAGWQAHVELSFKPTIIAAADIALTPQMRWILAAPRSEVAGVITLAGRSSPFRGVGFHEHFVSTVPLGSVMTDWFRGRLLIGNETICFHQMSLVDDSQRAAVRLVRATATGIIELEVKRAAMEMKPATTWRPAYPLRAQISDDLMLSKPRVLSSSRGWNRLEYEAVYAGRSGVALCESISTYRFR